MLSDMNGTCGSPASDNPEHMSGVHCFAIPNNAARNIHPNASLIVDVDEHEKSRWASRELRWTPGAPSRDIPHGYGTNVFVAGKLVFKLPTSSFTPLPLALR